MMKKLLGIGLAVCMMALIVSTVPVSATEIDLQALADEIAIVPENSQSEVAQSEAAQSEVAQSEAAQSEAAQSEATQSEAAQSEAAQSEVTQSEPFDFSQPIRVGYYSAYNDVIVDLDSLNNKGYGYEIFQKISQISGLEFEFVPVEDSMIEAVNSGYVDVGGFNTRSDERRELVQYSEMAYTKSYIALMTHDMDMRYADISAIDGKTVAVYDENAGVEQLDEFCRQNNITVDYVYAETDDYMSLDTDFYITYSEDPTSLELNNVLNLGVYNLYLISSFENADVLAEIDSHFWNIIFTEGNYFMELEEKYLAHNVEISHRGLTQSEVDILQQRPLEVAYITGYAPISFMNENGEADGALVDVLNSYATFYGFEVNYHPYSLSDPPEAHEDFDLMLTLYGDGEHEWEHYALTDPFYTIPVYAQVNLDLQNSIAMQDILATSPKIGMLRYQTLDVRPFLEVYPDIEFVYYNEWHDLLDSFAAGELDLLFATDSAATYAEYYLDDMNRATIHTDVSIPMQFFINHDIAAEYVPIFNVMMDKWSVRDYEIIIENQANANLPTEEVSFLDFLAANWYYFAIIFFIIACGFIALYAHGQINKKMALLKSYNTDRLTGFMTNRRFGEAIDEVMQTARPGEYELVAFDIDMFRTINTHFSNERGTTIILAIADALRKAFEDTSAMICRRTAEQFLILRRVDDGGTMREVYNTYIFPNIEENISEKYRVSLSFGNVIIDNVQEKHSTFIGQADNARLAGKSTHKTTFITFDNDMRKVYENKINITFRMEQALKDREFVVEYQPKIDFNTLTMGGAEALVRWMPQHGDKIYPDQFIPVFEKNGFIADLDMYVLEEVCRCLKENCRKMEIPRIAVNLSAHTVLADNVVKRISRILSAHNITSSRIELELTESAIETDTELFLERVSQFKKLGFCIAIDDFGAGVSSLNRISAVDADVLKLDKAFFDMKDQGAKSTVVVTDVINMAKHLDMQVVAEGVETSAQALWLKGIGCDYAQGYYFEKPMGEDAFKEALSEKKQYNISLL